MNDLIRYLKKLKIAVYLALSNEASTAIRCMNELHLQGPLFLLLSLLSPIMYNRLRARNEDLRVMIACGISFEPQRAAYTCFYWCFLCLACFRLKDWCKMPYSPHKIFFILGLDAFTNLPVCWLALSR